MLTKEDFERLEAEAEVKSQEDFEKEADRLIDSCSRLVFDRIVNFCLDEDLDPDPVIQRVVKQLSAERRRQIKKLGYVGRYGEDEDE